MISFFKKAHICVYSKPIVSRYVSFNTRDIVYECKCGKRKLKRQFFSYNQPFPIETKMFITVYEIKQMENESN